MRWKQDYFGILRLVDNKENKTIRIESEEIGGQMDDLERLEPWESERVLGVHLPMNGDMKKEFNHRVKQIDGMAKRLFRAPFSYKDAEIVYQVRYKAAIRYPLPVTLFTSKLCTLVKKIIDIK